ncbi:MAG: hypothetical protein Q8R18_03320, partial [bacterium]|nr:hypothetical protein [bacterium]
MKILVLLCIFLALLPLSLAYSYDSYHTEVEMEDEQAYVNTEIQGSFASKLSLSLPLRIEDLSVFVDEKEISCTALEEETNTKLSCSLEQGIHFVQILYHTNAPLLSLSEGNAAFQWNEEISAEEFIFILKLPEQATMIEQQLLVPQPERTYFDGRRTVLVWEEKSFEEDFSTSVLYQEKSSSFPWYLLILLFLIPLAIYFFKRRKKGIFISGALLE